jgi:O-antigen/teichoic acid export membrane protein
MRRPLDVTDCVAASVASSVLNAGAGLLISLRLLTPAHAFRPDRTVVPRILRQGLGGWVAVLCATFASLIVATLLSRRVGSTALGHYQLVLTIGAWVYAVISSVNVPVLSLWAALASQGRLRGLRRNLRVHQMATASLSLLAAVAAVAAAPQILDLLYGSAYRENATVLRIAAVAWVSLGFGCWYWISFTALGHPGWVMVPNIVWGAVQVVSAWALIRWFSLGIAGAIAAYAIAYVCWCLSYEVIFRRCVPTRDRIP